VFRDNAVSLLGAMTRMKHNLINIDEAAKYLDLAKPTLYAMASQRRIPYVKVGRLLKFDLEKLDQWIQQNSVMPMPERRP
jgi:excisionase family DNA binding protein